MLEAAIRQSVKRGCIALRERADEVQHRTGSRQTEACGFRADTT
jgi:hypothetical protein